MSGPLVELLADGREPPSEVIRLLGALRLWCTPVVPDPVLGAPAARIVLGTRSPGLPDALADASTPMAVVVDPDEALSPETQRRADVLVRRGGRRAASDPADAIALPGTTVDTARHPMVPTAVRDGWRRLLGLPDPLVVTLGYPGERAWDDEVVPSVLAVASAAAVRGRWLLTALSLGTPVVTDAASATHVGADDGEHLIVAPVTRARDEALVLADDPLLTARIGRAGRRLVEDGHDMNRIARRIAAALQLVGSPKGPLGRLAAVMDALDTNPADPLLVHARSALGPFVASASRGLP